MGVDTKLLLNPRWDIEDIVTVLEKHLDIKATVESKVKIHSTYFNLHCDKTTYNSLSLICSVTIQKTCPLFRGYPALKILAAFNLLRKAVNPFYNFDFPFFRVHSYHITRIEKFYDIFLKSINHRCIGKKSSSYCG